MNIMTMSKLPWKTLVFVFLAAAMSVCAFAADDDKNGTTMEIYGFAMLDMGYQTNQNDPDWFDVLRPTKLPAFENEFGADEHRTAGPGRARTGQLLEHEADGERAAHFRAGRGLLDADGDLYLATKGRTVDLLDLDFPGLEHDVELGALHGHAVG